LSHLLPLIGSPALPLGTAGKYVAAAYIVAFVIVAAYVAIMAIRLRRMERTLGELAGESDGRGRLDDSGLALRGERLER
jgi:hypothetical protein